MSRARRLAGPLALGVVLGVALLVGSGLFDPAPPADAARVAAIERDVKCPSCIDLSVAQSNSESSIALRHVIVAEVAAGRTDAEILDGITARYGLQALLVPPGGGLTNVLWAVPVALAAGAAIAVCSVVVRRRRRS